MNKYATAIFSGTAVLLGFTLFVGFKTALILAAAWTAIEAYAVYKEQE